MLIMQRILVMAIALAGGMAALAGCGQKGALFIPTEPAAANRATLPQTLRPSLPAAPATGASAVSPAAQ